MPIGELAMHYVLCKMCKIKVKKDCLWEQRTHKKKKKKKKITKIGKTQAISLKFWYRILVPDFFQLVPANTNRSTTLIENPTNCKQNVYSRFGLTATERMLYHRACSRRPSACGHMRHRARHELNVSKSTFGHLHPAKIQISLATRNKMYRWRFLGNATITGPKRRRDEGQIRTTQTKHETADEQTKKHFKRRTVLEQSVRKLPRGLKPDLFARNSYPTHSPRPLNFVAGPNHKKWNLVQFEITAVWDNSWNVNIKQN